MQKQSYEIIVLDLDGTLTNREKIITPRTKAAIMEAQRRGKRVVFDSGRPTMGVTPLAKELCLGDHHGFILSFNGGTMIDCASGETIFSRMLPAESNQRIMELADENQVAFLTYEGERLLTNDAECPSPLVEIEDIRSYLTFEVPKFLFVDDGGYLAMVEPRVKAALGKNFSVYRSDPYFLEILPKGIDKAQSLERLLGYLGISRERMIACGDGYNDLSMIRYAGLGVAMENAVLSLRKEADYITSSNNDDGVAEVIEKFML